MVNLSPALLLVLRALCSLHYVKFYANAAENKNESIASPSAFSTDNSSVNITTSSSALFADGTRTAEDDADHHVDQNPIYETFHHIEASSSASTPGISTNIERKSHDDATSKLRTPRSSRSVTMDEAQQGIIESSTSTSLSRSMMSIGDTFFRQIGQEGATE